MQPLVDGLVGAVLGAAAFTGLHAMGLLGWGDVKLMAALGAMLGTMGTIWALALTPIIGALHVGFVLTFNTHAREIFANGGGLTLPFAVSMALGSGAALWRSAARVYQTSSSVDSVGERPMPWTSSRRTLSTLNRPAAPMSLSKLSSNSAGPFLKRRKLSRATT